VIRTTKSASFVSSGQETETVSETLIPLISFCSRISKAEGADRRPPRAPKPVRLIVRSGKDLRCFKKKVS
jgi:hypothetical protein